MELILSTDLDKSLPRSIDFNHEAIIAYLDENLIKYNDLVVTEDTIPDARKDRANLNKFKEAIETRRKEIKAQCLAPYEEFERKIKEITAKIDEPIQAIDGQLKAFEDAKKKEKAEAIRAFFDENVGELVDLLTFENISNPRWLNATYKMSDIEKEVLEKIEKVKTGLRVISDFHSEFEVEIKETFLQTLELSLALGKKAMLEKRARELEALKAKTRETIEINGSTDLSKLQPGDRVQFGGCSESAPPAQEELKTIKVIFYDTTEAFRWEMRELTQKHNIKYGGIK